MHCSPVAPSYPTRPLQPKSQHPKTPSTNTGRPRENELRAFRPARASEPTPAYARKPATSQALAYLKGHPGLARRNGHFPGPQRYTRNPAIAPDGPF